MNTPTSGSPPDDDGQPPGSLVLADEQGRPASKEHSRFQRLVARIGQKRELLASWQAYVLRYNQRIRDELEPLQVQLRGEQQQMVELLDELLTQPDYQPPLDGGQRAKLQALLFDLLEDLLGAQCDATLEAIHDRHSDVTHQEVRRSAMERTRIYIEEVMGLHIEEDHGASTVDELLQYARHLLQERADEGEIEDQENAQPDTAGPEAGAMAHATQSLREVFRKLASALHPDRELDEQIRERKTLLMQQVNQAYEARDLLTLLTLQLEIEQVTATSLSSASGERLAHYNQILHEQLRDLDLELEHCVAPFRQRLDDYEWQSLTIDDVEHGLDSTCALVAARIRELRADQVAFGDPARLSDYLRRFELEPEPDEPDDMDEVAELVRNLRVTPRRPGRRN